MLKKILIVFFVINLFFASFLNAQSSDESLIQMAILLDTSNSMDGLIDQAKSQLWKIVNELALSKKNGKSPRLEVALYQYGNSGLSSYDGYIEMVSPLTTDLDLISDKLFNLKTYGGDEYCGHVIKEAVSDLKWNKSPGILKLIFIAGNEPFDQGKVDYRKSCKEAISKGIIVNTIHCGDFKVGIDTFWKKGADIADGKYVCIDQSIRDVYVEAPQDKEIESLNEKLNDTYVYYGKGGAEKKDLQVKQDSNALVMNKESYIQRSITKSKKQYDSSSWDLIDAVKNNNLNIDELKDNEIPPEIRKMSKEERLRHIEELAKKRQEIQEKIARLNEERTKYISNVKKENSKSDTLESAIIKSIREQAEKKNYSF